MKRLIPYVAFACLTVLTSSSGLTVIAGSCNGNMNKSAKIDCSQNDPVCQIDKSKKIDLKQSVNS